MKITLWQDGENAKGFLEMTPKEAERISKFLAEQAAGAKAETLNAPTVYALSRKNLIIDRKNGILSLAVILTGGD